MVMQDGGWAGISATHQKQQHFPGFTATSSVGPPHFPKAYFTQHKTLGWLSKGLHGGGNADFFFKTKSPTQRGWVNCIISHLALRTWEEERSRGEKIMRRNFGVHQSYMLFVKGAQRVLKWQIASCATWINIDFGHL